MLAALVIVGFADQLQAIESESLRAPLQGVKKEIFSYMFVIKIAAVVVGAAFSIMKQVLSPLGIGAGVFIGIQFFDHLIGDGSTALIGA